MEILTATHLLRSPTLFLDAKILLGLFFHKQFGPRGFYQHVKNGMACIFALCIYRLKVIQGGA